MQLALSTVFQLILFSIVPYLYWRSIRGRKPGFFNWIGLKAIQTKSKRGFIELVVAIASAVVFFVFLGVFIIPKLIPDQTVLAQSQFTEISMVSIFGILVYAFIQTGLSEEILFRGFIGKFFIRRLGYFTGNCIQAFLFGLLHGIIFFGKVPVFSLILIILITGSIGYFLGYMNEKKAQGSILPSWIAHGLANTIAALLFILLF